MEGIEPGEFIVNATSEGFHEAGRFTSDDGLRVAVYGPKPSRVYTYALYFWDRSEYEFIGDGYWCCCEVGGLYDELESAKADAKRALYRVAG